MSKYYSTMLECGDQKRNEHHSAHNQQYFEFLIFSEFLIFANKEVGSACDHHQRDHSDENQ